jgi:hypothetical protein
VDDPVRDQRLTDLGFWSRVSDGVQWISRLVAAAAVLSLLSKFMSVPPSTWIDTVLAAYRALFHPIVDGTIGLIPRVFGRVLLPATKDAIIVYGILCGSVFRAFVALSRDTEEREPRLALILPSIFWPISLAWGFSVLVVFARVFPEEQGNPSRGALMLSKAVAKELLIIIVVAAIAIALNAVGKL